MNELWKIKPKRNRRELSNKEVEFIISNIKTITKRISEEPNPLRKQEMQIRIEELHERLVLLDKDQMQVIIMRIYHNKKFRAIARKMKRSLKYVWTLYQRAIHILSSER